MRLSQKMARSGKRKKPPPLESRRGGWQYERRRVRKKQKRLDAICDKAYTVAKSNEAANVAGSAPGTAEPDPAHFRRSSRLRKTPVVFDASPSPSKRNPKIGSSNKKVDTGSANRRKGKGLFVKSSPSRDFRDSKDKENWGSRLRARVKNDGVGTFKGMSSRAGAKRKLFGDSELDDRGDRDDRDDGFEDMVSPVAKSKRICKAEGSTDEKSRDPITGSCSREEENNERTLRDWISDSNVEAMSPPKSAGNSGNERVDFDNSELVIEKEDDKTTAGLSLDEGPNGNKDLETTEERDKVPEQPYADDLRTRTLADENVVNVENLNPVSNDTLEKPPRIREGRRCGLCGGGTDGRPPKRLVLDAGESDSEAYGGSSASEDPNYDVWDGFGDEPSWLGRLLGPINDRFGIAGVWVHQQCAVWSPEVYFAGLGCLKNVRRALCRGRALKCSRCGRPGATVGCRVDRCPKTYHLPCGRADGCIFDHRKFLIACTDHRHLFQLQGDHYLRRIKKMKAKKMRLDMRKGSNDAWWNDCEAEEKWLENCGEDEEFLKREGKRLHRDISRIAPVYIGGSFSESEKLYQGWESVAGLQHVIRCMKEVVILPLLYPEFFSTMGLTPPRGVLLHGYPGTGKTLVVRALIGACSRGDKRIAYFARKGADCLGKYVGDAERQLRLLFQVAERSQPSIIFFDEIDGLAPRRSRQQDQTHSSVVSTLLALLDGLKSRGSVIVIGATNRPEAVDPALRRPGRFDREIYFPLPSVKDRSAILSLHTQRWPKPVSGSLLKWVATQTVGFAGADLQALCTQAAMIALKRNFPLQELLSAAEKFPNHSRCLSLPSFAVEERDWLAALACAPPPCSRREAGMAANDVVSSPLHAHLIPCLLQPLSLLLISLYHDERIRLPPALYNAAMIIKGVIISALERKKAPIVFWLSHFHNMIEEPDVMKEIERNLSDSGFINDTCAFPNSGPLEDDNDYDCGKFELFKLIPGGARVSSSLMQNLSYSWGKTSGFRVLIAGNPRSGQRHVATCLLHGFKGHIEIQKVDLATISQEGRGDIVSGITRILLKCLSVGQCIIYMPRIDLWALDETNLQSTRKENNFCPKTSKSALTEGLHDAIVTSSEAWNSFIEQVDSMCISTSFMILATCEMPKHALPLRMRQFFTSDLLNCTVSAPSEHTIPRFCLQIDGNFNHEMVIDLSAAKLSRDLVQQYVQLMHQRTHVHDAFKEFKICDTMQVHKEVENHKTDNGAINEVMPMPVDSERIASNGGTSCIDVQMQQCINDDKQRSPLFKTNCQRKDEVQVQSHQDSVSRIPPNRIAKGKSNLLLTIATFGYQILRYPHFAELCWATSKLKEGPCTGVDGPRKGWPFNSCVIRAMSSLEKGAVGCSSIDIKNREHSGVVRGLIAVGLMAYKGVYTSIREVSVEVRKVLELLVGQINAKILGGKDRYRFLRLLSQVAYLEDMVNTWAYTLRSLEVDNQISMSSTRSAIVGGMDNHACGSGLAENDACMPSDHNNSRRDANFQEQSPLTVVTENGECVASYGVTHLPNSGTSIMISDGEPCQEMLSPKTSIPDLRRTSGATAGSLATENASNEMHKTNHVISESPVPPAELKRLGFLKHSNGLMGTEVVFPNGDDVHDLGQSAVIINSSSKKVYDRCNGIADNVLSSKDGGYNHDVPGAVSISTFKESSNLPAVSETSCLYDCCSECLHAVNVLIREILVDRWESNGCCSTVEDVHNVVSSCSASLLAAIRKSYVAESSMDSEVFCGGPGRKPKDGAHNEGCACRAVVDNKVKKETSWSKCSGKKQVMPMECSCHLRSKEATATTNSLRSSQIGLKKFFRDSTLVDTDPDKDVLFHCKFETLCMCSLIERILMVKQPID